jgi:hypothetical protein
MPVPKEEWGTKRVCPTTGKRFYDLNKQPIVSPYTGETVVLDTSKTGRMMVADKGDAAKEKAVEEEESVVLDEEEDVELEDDSDDEVLEDDNDDDVSLDDIADVADEGDDD